MKPDLQSKLLASELFRDRHFQTPGELVFMDAQNAHQVPELFGKVGVRRAQDAHERAYIHSYSVTEREILEWGATSRETLTRPRAHSRERGELERRTLELLLGAKRASARQTSD